MQEDKKNILNSIAGREGAERMIQVVRLCPDKPGEKGRFGTDEHPWLLRQFGPRMRAVSDSVQAYWGAFARFGDPNSVANSVAGSVATCTWLTRASLPCMPGPSNVCSGRA